MAICCWEGLSIGAKDSLSRNFGGSFIDVDLNMARPFFGSISLGMAGAGSDG